MYGILMLKIRWFQDILVFNMGIHMLVRQYHYIETAPRYHRIKNPDTEAYVDHPMACL